MAAQHVVHGGVVPRGVAELDREDSFRAWEADLMKVFGEVREVYGYFNNHWAGHSPASANEMKRRLGLPFVEPRDCWPQGELF